QQTGINQQQQNLNRFGELCWHEASCTHHHICWRDEKHRRTIISFRFTSHSFFPSNQFNPIWANGQKVKE
ncbi:unnamed protein product, partial [Litomosoides sigmodontis]